MTAQTAQPIAGDSSALLARLHPSLYLSNHLAHGSRPSSSASAPLHFPQVDLNLSPISSGPSSSQRPASIPSPSALVKYGSTTVICNVTSSIVPVSAASSSSSTLAQTSSSATSSPYSATIIPSISLTPLSSPSNDFKAGAPSTYAQSITERLHSFLDAAMPFDPSILDIPTDSPQDDALPTDAAVKAKWCLFADCTVIGFDGGLLEASMLAVVAALRQVYLPKASFSLDDNTVIASPRESGYWSLQDHMQSLPVAFGFGISQGTLLTTPSSFESDLISSSISFALSYGLSNSEASLAATKARISSGKKTQSQPLTATLCALSSTGPLCAANAAAASKALEDEDLLTYCVETLAEKRGREIVSLILAKEKEIKEKR